MKNLKLHQSAGYIYDAEGYLIAHVFENPLKGFESRDLADIFCISANTLLNNIYTIRELNDSINKVERLVLNMDLPTRNALDTHVEKAHKSYKKLFTNSKLLSKVVQFLKPINHEH